MRKFLLAAIATLFALHAVALEMKPRHQHGRPVHRKSAADVLGPYFLGFAGHCNVFELWYDAETWTIYGNEIGCTGGATGQPVMGTIDTDGTDLYLTVGGKQNAMLIDVDLYDGTASWGETAGDDPDLDETDVTLDINPVAPDSGPSLLQ